MTNQKKILYAEDDAIFHSVISHRLEGIGVDIAPNLEEAVNLASKTDYDLFVSDGTYPLTKGGEVDKTAWRKFYEYLSSNKRSMEFILFSGDMDAIKDAKSLGIKAYSKLDLKMFIEYIKNKLKGGK